MARPTQALSHADITRHLAGLTGWQRIGEQDDACIEKTFRFPGYDETMAFVNAVAVVAQVMDHHPELVVGFNRCTVRYQTHDVRGISHLDFDAAQRVDAVATPF